MANVQYRPEIDGLRALAVLPVLGFHAGVHWMSGGYVGVDVFFVISGFLITTILYREIAGGNFSLLTFYERRARRILPALLFVCSVTALLGLYFLSPNAMLRFAESLLATIFFGSNIYFMISQNYFAPAAELSPLLHMWSLAVEEQFYLAFPLVLAALHAVARKQMIALLVLGIAASLVLSQYLSAEAPTANFYLLPARAWELGAGALIALLHEKGHSPKQSALGSAAALSGLVMIIGSIVLLDDGVPFPGIYAIPVVLGSALFIRYASAQNFAGRVMAWPPLVGIGLISYSLYLWHQPLFAFARVRLEHEQLPFALAALSLLSMGLAWLTWRYVENPFRNRSAYSRKRIFVFSGFGMAAMSGVALALMATGGLPQGRLDPWQEEIMASAQSSSMRRDCHSDVSHPIEPDDACRLGEGPLRYAVIGDSHSVETALALSELVEDGSVLQLSHAACAPVPAPASANACAGWLASAAERIAREPSIKAVVIQFRWNVYLAGDHRDSARLQQIFTPEELRIGLARLIEIVSSADRQVVVIGQPPELPAEFDTLVWFRAREGPIEGYPRAWWIARNGPALELLQTVEHQSTVIDPTSRFCSDSQCFASFEGAALYFDDDHTSMTGARLIAADILAKLAESET